MPKLAPKVEEVSADLNIDELRQLSGYNDPAENENQPSATLLGKDEDNVGPLIAAQTRDERALVTVTGVNQPFEATK